MAWTENSNLNYENRHNRWFRGMKLCQMTINLTLFWESDLWSSKEYLDSLKIPYKNILPIFPRNISQNLCSSGHSSDLGQLMVPPTT